MTSDVHTCDISVGDRVKVLVGEHLGDEGRVVTRKFYDAFGIIGVVFEVDFEFAPQGRGYTIQFQPIHLERLAP